MPRGVQVSRGSSIGETSAQEPRVAYQNRDRTQAQGVTRKGTTGDPYVHLMGHHVPDGFSWDPSTIYPLGAAGPILQMRKLGLREHRSSGAEVSPL